MGTLCPAGKSWGRFFEARGEIISLTVSRNLFFKPFLDITEVGSNLSDWFQPVRTLLYKWFRLFMMWASRSVLFGFRVIWCKESNIFAMKHSKCQESAALIMLGRVGNRGIGWNHFGISWYNNVRTSWIELDRWEPRTVLLSGIPYGFQWNSMFFEWNSLFF